jgi:hypothetical protein
MSPHGGAGTTTEMGTSGVVPDPAVSDVVTSAVPAPDATMPSTP